MLFHWRFDYFISIIKTLGVYISPNNAVYKGKHIEFQSKDPSAPDQFIPKLSGHAGGNWFDLDTHLLYVVVKGEEVVDLVKAPVIQVNFILVFFFYSDH